jgi:hypothetical protein
MTTPGRKHFYGHRLHDRQTQERHYLQSCVRPDVWAVIQQLVTEHGLSISGAAHHLMRLGAGLSPLSPFKSDDN